MNTKAIMNAKAAVVLFSLILAACGGGSSDGGGESEPAEVATYETHSTNVSGVWSGTVTSPLGAAVVVIVTINQAVSDSAESPAQALTGTVTLDGGAPFNLTGTKEGDAWSVSGEAPGWAVVSTDQTLSSAGDSSGTLIINELPHVTTTMDLSLTKV